MSKLRCDNTIKTNNISEDDISKFTDEEYDINEKKMDIHTLHTVFEQRCKQYGCRLHNCLSKLKDVNKCNQIFRELNKCCEIERKKVIYEFITTGQQPKY